MKRKIIYSLTIIIFIILLSLILGLFIKKDNKNTDVTTIKVSDTTLT